jgi:MoaA/NifB/PqqE/SkfB family radical SAM enzyme
MKWENPGKEKYIYPDSFLSGERLGSMEILTSDQRTDVWKLRYGPAGLHAFNRKRGLNILLDEVSVPASLYSRAPRQVSIALTNRCDLNCVHCYAPKHRSELGYGVVRSWLAELDANGTLGIGFGGGEPTLYPDFAHLCQFAARETQLCVTFTTHGHLIDEAMADELRGSVHFIRLSMDGVGDTYESIRRRSFKDLLARMRLVQTIASFGINFVVNEQTLSDLDEAVAIATDLGGCELLLLPQMATGRCSQVSDDTMQGLRRWVEGYRGRLRLCINEGSAEGLPTCDPIAKEQGLRAYAHIDAAGALKPSSYQTISVPISAEGVLGALNRLTHIIEENNQ